MSADIVRGIMTTPDQNQDKVVIDMDKMIHFLDEKPSIWYALDAMLAKTEATHSKRFEWLEDNWLPWHTTSPAGVVDAVITTIVVADASFFVPNDSFVVDGLGGERCLITAVNTTTNTLTIVRGYGSTAAAAIPAGAVIISSGHVQELAGDIPEAVQKIETTKENYIQIFQRTVKTGHETFQEKLKAGKNERANQILKNMEEINMQRDRALLFGQKYIDDTTGNKRKYSTGGIDEFVQTHRTDAGGNLTETAFLDWLVDHAFAKGSKTKLIVIGNIISRALATWLKASGYKYSTEMKELGVNVMEYILPDGRVAYFMHSEFFNEIPTLKGTAIVIDPKSIIKRSFEPYRLTMNLPHTANFWIDKLKEICGYEVANEEKNAILDGVTSFS